MDEILNLLARSPGTEELFGIFRELTQAYQKRKALIVLLMLSDGLEEDRLLEMLEYMERVIGVQLVWLSCATPGEDRMFISEWARTGAAASYETRVRLRKVFGTNQDRIDHFEERVRWLASLLSSPTETHETP